MSGSSRLQPTDGRRLSDRGLRALFAGLVLATICAGRPAAAAPPTIRQSLDLVRPLAPQVSPSGDAVAYALTRTNWKANSFDQDIWLVTTNGVAAPRRLSAPEGSASSAAWAPDGRRIAFLSDTPPGSAKRGPPQVVVFDLASGLSRRLTDAPEGVSAFRWSPDGSQIAYVAGDPPAAAETMRDAREGAQIRLPASQPGSRVWEVSASGGGGSAHAVTPPGFVASDIAYAPDGRRLAVVAQAVSEPELTPHVQLYVADTDGAGGWRPLVSGQGILRSPTWSPDGRRIAFLLGDRRNYLHSDARVVAVPAAGGALDVLDPGFDLDPDLIGWTPAGLLVDAYDRTSLRLFRIDPASRRVAALSPADDLVEAPSVTADGRRVAFLGARPGGPRDVAVADLAGWRERRLTHTGDQYRAFSRTIRELVRWRAPDGVAIEGVLEKPEGLVAPGRRPLLVILHGGPDWLDTPYLAADRDYPAERFLARGALVLRVNYRGSLGYGAAFRALNRRAMGRPEADDVVSGVDHLVRLGLADPARVGVMGWSAGGFITAFAATCGDHFKAASVGGGITDWRSFYLTSNLPQDPVEFFGAMPFQDPAIYAASSPITCTPIAGTPTLIQHGADDPRVPLSQARELYRALSARGVPVRLNAFVGQGHQVRKPIQQSALMQQNEDWFGHYLWGDPPLT